jgi:hypothetical protein
MVSYLEVAKAAVGATEAPPTPASTCTIRGKREISAPPSTDDLAQLTPDERELWGERAAIREYDGGFDTAEAERLALLDVLEIRESRR